MIIERIVMESLILSFNAVTPLFILMLLGYVIKRLGIAKKADFDMINKLVFKIFLPVLLFQNLYTTETIDTFDIKIVMFTVIGVMITFAAGYIYTLFAIKENSKKASVLQGFFRSNFAILGIPLINSICADNVTGLTYLMVAVVVPLFNVLAVLCFELYGNGKKTSVVSVLKGIATNPLIVACVIGIVFFAFKIKLPFVVEKSVSDVSKIATPLAIVAIGGSFAFGSIKGCIKEVAVTVGARLVVVPLIAVVCAVLLGFTGEALACILITFGGPIAISSFSMAQQMGGDEDIAANVVVFSSMLCIVTMFVWIYLLSALGLF